MKLNVDKIYCLHCLEDKDRYDFIINNIINYGGEELLNQTYITEYTKLSINTYIGDTLNKLHTPYYDGIKSGNNNVYGNVFSCMYNWLQMISHAYKSNYDSILCIEDDIIFDENINEFNHYLNDIPEDADIILFGYKFSGGYAINGSSDFNLKKNSMKYIKTNNDYKLTGMFGVYFNKRGMEYYLKYIQQNICCSDLIFVDINNIIQKEMNINIYICNKEFIKHNYNFSSLIV